MWRHAYILVVFSSSLPALAQVSNDLSGANDATASLSIQSPVSIHGQDGSPSVRDLIEQLGDPDFAVRERATDTLEAMGPLVLVDLRSAYHSSDRFEIRSKLRDLAESIDMQQRLFSSVGFLGVQPAAVLVNSLPGQTDAVVGIHIGFVVPGEAAERAGIEVGDVIVAVDGKPLPPGADAERFASLLREAGPGAVLRFTILRDREIIERSTALGQRPIEFYMGRGDSWYYERLSESMSAFRQWWFEDDPNAEPAFGRRFPSTLRFPVDWDPAADSSDATVDDAAATPLADPDPSSLP